MEYFKVPKLSTCPCGSGHIPHWLYDARGIPLARVCDTCEAEKLAKYRPDVLTDPDYWHDEEL